jgi:hypothetical protein
MAGIGTGTKIFPYSPVSKFSQVPSSRLIDVYLEVWPKIIPDIPSRKHQRRFLAWSAAGSVPNPTLPWFEQFVFCEDNIRSQVEAANLSRAVLISWLVYEMKTGNHATIKELQAELSITDEDLSKMPFMHAVSYHPHVNSSYP